MNCGLKYTDLPTRNIRVVDCGEINGCNWVITYFVGNEISRFQYLKLINSYNGRA